MPRWFDLALASFLLLLALPVGGLIALTLRLSGGRGVFLRQYRIGLGGERFAMLKFRTMYRDAEDRLREHLAANPAARIEWERYQMLRNDPRIFSGFALFLRRHSLDELPQLINVLRGEMSLVGPRPLTEEFSRYLDSASAVLRQSVRPGMTGLWQVSGRDSLPIEVRRELDLRYVHERSWAFDAGILVSTIREVIKPRQATDQTSALTEVSDVH